MPGPGEGRGKAAADAAVAENGDRGHADLVLPLNVVRRPSAGEGGDCFGVDAGRGSQETLALRGPGAALGVGDPSAGLGDEQRPGKQVRAGPGELPEGVDP